ncbi:hypothetical protein ACMA5I_02520 [Paracoccaceae bacterium GXU_MW_L88]
MISAIASLISAGALVTGVAVAWKGLDSWKREKLAVKRADLGEELIALASDISFKLSAIRSPFGHPAPDGDENEDTYDLRRRIQELMGLDEEYLKLRRLQVRQKYLFGSEEVDNAISQIFDGRSRLLNSLIKRVRQIARQTPSSERQLDELDLLENTIFEDGGDSDEFKAHIDNAISIIEDRMIPLIRLGER